MILCFSITKFLWYFDYFGIAFITIDQFIAVISSISWKWNHSSAHVFNYGHVEEYLFFGMFSVFLFDLMTRGKRWNWPFWMPRFRDSFHFHFLILPSAVYTSARLAVCSYASLMHSSLLQCEDLYKSALDLGREGFLISSETLAVTGNRPTTYVHCLRN